ncbi:hypothetical protein [Kitasatospora sp. NPDC097643]|uniref:hypothetical protein n=1 Tax=Kitasatospora sp. NPDC097643 TaxID=3157230 RepID=UPI0033304DC6
MPCFMTLIRIDEDAREGWEPVPGFEQRMGALFEEITKAGVMLETAGLTPTAQGTRLSWAHVRAQNHSPWPACDSTSRSWPRSRSWATSGGGIQPDRVLA